MSITKRKIYGLAAVGIAGVAMLVFHFRDFVLPPPPGYCVALLGLVAVVMTLVLSKEPSKREKAAWIGCAFFLMVFEMFAISHDRTKQDEAFRTMLTGVEDSIKTQTGGDSFAFISFTPQLASSFEMHLFNFLAPRGVPYFMVSITSQGKYPLRGVHAILMDDEQRLAAMQEYNRNPSGDWIHAINSADVEYQIPYLRPQSQEAPSGEVDVIGLYPMSQTDSKRLTVAFSAPNGYWSEVLHLGRVTGVWHQCLSLIGPTVKQTDRPFIYCDTEDWPEGRKLAQQDWQFPKPQAPAAVR
jgi:hypothetical protein